MNSPYKWKSQFGKLAQEYLSFKRQNGKKFLLYERYLQHFDNFFYLNGFNSISLTKEIVNDFIYNINERPITHHKKEVVMRDFAKYLEDRGYKVFVVDIKTSLPRNKHIPYIFTDEEISRLFMAIDNYPQPRGSGRNIVNPVLFRFLYSTGVRISEALNIVLSDLDIKSGIVTIHNTKNAKDRLLPMSSNLTKIIVTYLDDFHRNSSEDMWLFPSYYFGVMKKMSHTAVYCHFRDYLLMADIPHPSGGPCIHSLRHGFAVKNLKNWALAGEDLSILLPYLSAYMGHSDFRSTQYYLRLTTDLYPEILRLYALEFGSILPDIE